MLQCPLITYLCRKIIVASQMLPNIEYLSLDKIIYNSIRAVVSSISSRQYKIRLEEGLLTLTKIESSSNYKSEGETSTSFILSLYILSPPTLPPLSSTLINSLLFYYNTIQHSSINLE